MLIVRHGTGVLQSQQKKMSHTLKWLQANNPLYKNVVIDNILHSRRFADENISETLQCVTDHQTDEEEL